MKSKTTIILWAVFIGVLLVLLPHTAWTFRQFEPVESPAILGSFDAADLVSYVAALAFESAIAVLTHKLAKHIEAMRRGKSRWEKFEYRYLNPFAFGLFAATAISMLANLAHAVEFGTAMQIFTKWGIPPAVYSVAFGGILPLVSLTFARVLSNVVEDEEAPNPELDQAKVTIQELRRKFAESEQHRKATEAELTATEDRLRETEERAARAEDKAYSTELRANAAEDAWEKAESREKAAEDRAKLAEERFGAAGDLMALLFSENKKERIIAVKQWRPQLSGNAIAVIAETSPAYVSEVLSEAIDVTAEYAEAGK